ncbi:MAG: hypothetical protein WBB76_05105 [Gaiellaceae bacterium]
MIKALALAAFGAAALAWQHTPAPARLGVSAKEYHLVLSRASVKAGQVVIELDNTGEDVHDLLLRRIGGTKTYSLPTTTPGERVQLQAFLRPGRYRLWCSIADHAQLGMRAVLRVRR